jgi:hypothetical protein
MARKMLDESPSKRHVWKYEHPIERCLRCGCLYNPQHGGRAAVHCFPKPAWLKDHPEDDRKCCVPEPEGSRYYRAGCNL